MCSKEHKPCNDRAEIRGLQRRSWRVPALPVFQLTLLQSLLINWMRQGLWLVAREISYASVLHVCTVFFFCCLDFFGGWQEVWLIYNLQNKGSVFDWHADGLYISPTFLLSAPSASLGSLTSRFLFAVQLSGGFHWLNLRTVLRNSSPLAPQTESIPWLQEAKIPYLRNKQLLLSHYIGQNNHLCSDNFLNTFLIYFYFYILSLFQVNQVINWPVISLNESLWSHIES